MSEIDFLANKKADEEESKDQKDKAEPIIWSKPAEDKPLVKEVPFSWLAFLNKKKEVKNPAAESKPVAAPKPAVEKNKIRESRREILKFIKHNKNPELRGKKKAGNSLLVGLIEKLKKQPSHKEILIDYQRVFNQEKIKRSSFGETSDIKPAVIRQAPVRPVKIIKESRFSRFITSLKRWLLDLGASKARPAKVMARTTELSKMKEGAPQAAGENKPEIIKPARFAEASVRQVKARPSDFFNKLFKLIKDFILVPGLAKIQPARIKPAVPIKAVKSESTVPYQQPAKEKLAVAAIREGAVGRAGSAQIEEKFPKFLETNLIKAEIITFFDWRRKIIILINAIFMPVFIIAVIYFGLMYYQQQNQAKVQERIKRSNELAAAIAKAEIGLKEINDFQTRLKTVSKIFAQHIYWTNFFKLLEDNTIKDVYYTGFSGDTGGTYALDAVGASYSDISKQVSVLKNNEKITDVSTAGGEAVSGDAGGKGEVKFNLKFSILKSIFTE